jgi:hypothetical protein
MLISQCYAEGSSGGRQVAAAQHAVDESGPEKQRTKKTVATAVGERKT